MKKLLGIMVLGFLLSGNAYADDKKIQSFNSWLFKMGHHQYLNIEPSEKCKSFDKGDTNWYYNNCDKFQGSNNLDIKIYTERKSEIPYKKNPNRDTLLFYVYYYLEDIKGFGKYLIEPSKKPLEFNSNLKEDKFVKKQLQKKAILSYLYFEDDQIIVDEITPDDRFGLVFKNDTKWNSMSMGKSLVSYVTGHAICEGYIDGVNSRLNDWPLIENTLYHDQKLIDLLNMAAGDQKVIDDNVGLIKTKRWYNSHPISSFANRELKNTKKIESTRYHYNGLVTNIIMNYVIHKSNGNFQRLLNKIFQEKAKIKNSVFFLKQKGIEDKYGPGRYSLRASRYDYLRIAKAIMDDYQNQTCVGKYLKEIHEKRIKKNVKRGDEPDFNFSYSYGGQFHFDYPGLKNRIIFGLGGYAGQAILIDMENSRIVVLNSAHYNNSKYRYNEKKLLIDPIKKGK
jgi:CubicO group peptidase (beta-lactamase class C family)